MVAPRRYSCQYVGTPVNGVICLALLSGAAGPTALSWDGSAVPNSRAYSYRGTSMRD